MQKFPSLLPQPGGGRPVTVSYYLEAGATVSVDVLDELNCPMMAQMHVKAWSRTR